MAKNGQPKRRLILFVDDLDRCQTETIAKAFDAIRLITHLSGVVVVIGIDERIAFKAMGNAYQNYADESIGRTEEDVARDYLGKIIQVPIRLEAPTARGLRSYVTEKLFPAAVRAEAKRDGGANLEDVSISKQPIQPDVQLAENGSGVNDRVNLAPNAKTTLESTAPQPNDATRAAAKKEAEELREQMRDSNDEVDAFLGLSELFGFNNPRQLLRLRNTYRLLKALYPNRRTPAQATSVEMRYPEGEYRLLMMLFWLEFKTQFDAEHVRKWNEDQFSFRISDAARPWIIEILERELIPCISFDNDDLPITNDSWRSLEKFAQTCLLPYPSKEARKSAK